jgi:hypothetical protein
VEPFGEGKGYSVVKKVERIPIPFSQAFREELLI